jgi:pyrimidine operon attenuation protein/uracil phosphoribosyltransferase
MRNTWQGEFVSDNLDVKIENKNQIVGIKDLVGLALRKNPKRAHLLVSKVLGKHIPASPGLIIAAGQLLGAKAYDALGGRVAGMNAVSELIKSKLHGSEVEFPVEFPKYNISNYIPAIVVGYAETATSLGHIVAEYLDAPYIHSTRYGHTDKIPYGKFEEAHSHATSHKLLPDNAEFFNNELPMVLVDDELSTGKTILATIDELQSLNPRKKYIVVTLIDCRDEADKMALENFGNKIGAEIVVVSLSEGVVTYPEDIVERAAQIINDIPAKAIHHHANIWQTHKIKVDFSSFSHARYGIEEFDSELAKDIAHNVSEKVKGKTLILGTEEFMYLPLTVGYHLENAGVDVYSSSTTRSPVAPYDNSGYAIKNCLTFLGPENEERFAYNIEGFDTIVVIVEPGTELEEITKPGGLAQGLASLTKNIILVEGE